MKSEKIQIKINEKSFEAFKNETIISVADRMGIYIPRFCYHNKLSIAANCRMCMVEVEGVDVFFIGYGDLSQSMGYVGQQAHPDVQKVMEQGVKLIRNAGKVAGVSCPDNLVPKFLELGVQYFHGTVQTLIQTSSNTYLESMRKSAGEAGL